MEQGLYGVGLPHPGVECFIAQLNKLLTHYGSSSGLGIHMQVSMEVLIIEGGVSAQILSESFSCYGKGVTHCWLQYVWEKVDMFNFWVEISAIPLRLPREQDRWIMLTLVDQGFSEEELIHLNWVRCHQHILFVSDVFDASGRALDWRYLTWWPTAEVWSTLLFPKESPPHWDFHLWQRALHLLAPWGRAEHQLGNLVAKGHKICCVMTLKTADYTISGGRAWRYTSLPRVKAKRDAQIGGPVHIGIN
jgi:hypothetical protein